VNEQDRSEAKEQTEEPIEDLELSEEQAEEVKGGIIINYRPEETTDA
jgi:hypothetical protein